MIIHWGPLFSQNENCFKGKVACSAFFALKIQLKANMFKHLKVNVLLKSGYHKHVAITCLVEQGRKPTSVPHLKLVSAYYCTRPH
uniref:Uncharacterized protein n=1 Tax=Pyxicephalus adspersus TaxID=30357 RepID=A0AAV2ZVX4_PYXAD|nr:TPA: hypothetical protein GDO54_017007 [Pyxicephalus adspersus]